jgi:WD40 repeat protein
MWLEDFELLPGTRQLVLKNGRALNGYDLETDAFAPLSEWSETSVSGFDVSPDGAQMAVGAGASWLLYDLAEDALTGEFPSDFVDPTNERNLIYALAFSPEGDRLVTIQTDGRVHVWDVAAGELIAALGEFTSGVSQKWG